MWAGNIKSLYILAISISVSIAVTFHYNIENLVFVVVHILRHIDQDKVTDKLCKDNKLLSY